MQRESVGLIRKSSFGAVQSKATAVRARWTALTEVQGMSRGCPGDHALGFAGLDSGFGILGGGGDTPAS